MQRPDLIIRLAVDRASVLSVRLAKFSLNSKFLRLGKFKKYVGDNKSVGLAGVGGSQHRETEDRAGRMGRFLIINTTSPLKWVFS